MSHTDDAADRWRPTEADIDRIIPDQPSAADPELRALWTITEGPRGPDDWSALAARIRDERAAPAAPRGDRWTRLIPLAAAALLAGILLGGGALALVSGDAAGPGGITRLEVPGGATSLLHPAEGVTVRVGPGSTLAYVRHDDGRIDVDLTGEAFFDVDHRSNARLRVWTVAGEIRHIGTRFNVRARDERVIVTVEDGRVEFAAGGRTVIVSAGEQSAARSGDAPDRPQAVDVAAPLGWLDGRLAFVDQPLDEVAADIGWRFATLVEVDAALGGERITANLQGRTAEEAVGTLCTALGARCARTTSGWRITP